MFIRILNYDIGYVKISPSGFWLSFGLITAIVLAFYLLRGIGLFVMGKKAGLKYAFIAFIPFAWVYLLGVLCKKVFFFGYPIKKFALLLLTFYCVVSAIDIAYYVIVYTPLIGYYLGGGGVYIGMPADASYTKYLFDTRFYVEANKIVYSGIYSDLNAIITFLNVLYYVSNIFEIVNTILMITAYFALFRLYWPQHFLMAAVFCIFGFFPVFVFAVRNNKPMTYAEYIRARFGNYNIYGNPQNPNGTDNGQNGNAGENPFNDFNNGNTNGANQNANENKPSDDPFDEFKDK